MSRNSNPQKPKAKSPYQRYGKSEYRYSDLFNRWRAAIIRNDVPEARRLGAEHNRRFALSFPLDEAA